MSPLAGIAALALGAASISLGVIAIKEGYSEGADPQSMVAARMLVAAPCLLLALPLVWRRERPTRLWPAVLAVIAGTLLWISARAELEGLARLPAGMLVVLLSTVPVWVAVLAWIDVRRVPSRFERAALAAILVGVAVMSLPVGSSVNVVGVLGGLLSAVTFAVFLFVLERNRGVTASQAFPLGMIGAAVAVLVTDPGAIGGLAGGPPLWLTLAVGVSAAGWALFVGLGLAATSAVTAGMIVSVEPVLVAALAYAVLGEGLSSRQFAGGTIVILALASVAVRLHQSERALPTGGTVMR